MATWGEWNADIERIEISGRFAAGSTIAMTPAGQASVELRLSEASEPELFVDEADLGDVVVRTFHRIDRLDEGRSRVTYRMEISGRVPDSVHSDRPPDALVSTARQHPSQ